MNKRQQERIARLSPELRAQLEAAMRDRGLIEPNDNLTPPPSVVEHDPIPKVEAAIATENRPHLSAWPESQTAFSLIFFSDDGSSNDQDKYGLVLEAARFADAHDFCAVWVPERHFHPFGGLYPSPAVLAAAIASQTKNIGIRAGSVVLPLQHPVRVAEEWSMLDNLSSGRVGVAFASGWVPEDFVLAAELFDDRRETTFSRLETVRRLWRGESVKFPLIGHPEPIVVRVFPRPLQPELPVWITTSGTVETWLQAARVETNILTGLLQSTLPQLGENVDRYRRERSTAGYDAGWVTLMVHTFVGHSQEYVRQCVREPLLQYLRTHLNLYQMQKLVGARIAVDVSKFTDDDKEALVAFAFERYFQESGLFGTPETCLQQLDRIRATGVNEVACLIDFGVDRKLVLQSLESLVELRDRARAIANMAAEVKTTSQRH